MISATVRLLRGHHTGRNAAPELGARPKRPGARGAANRAQRPAGLRARSCVIFCDRLRFGEALMVARLVRALALAALVAGTGCDASQSRPRVPATPASSPSPRGVADLPV